MNRDYNMSMIPAPDVMVWKTQGTRTDRPQEHLGAGVNASSSCENSCASRSSACAQGLDPIGIIRDAEQNRLTDLNVINEPIGLVLTVYGLII